MQYCTDEWKGREVKVRWKTKLPCFPQQNWDCHMQFHVSRTGWERDTRMNIPLISSFSPCETDSLSLLFQISNPVSLPVSSQSCPSFKAGLQSGRSQLCGGDAQNHVHSFISITEESKRKLGRDQGNLACLQSDLWAAHAVYHAKPEPWLHLFLTDASFLFSCFSLSATVTLPAPLQRPTQRAAWAATAYIH